MYKISIFVLLLSCIPVSGFAQGIQFETGTWESVLEKAKKLRKVVYVDFYTTWCGPCKMMAANVFPKAEAGEKYNLNFVNYRIDAEKGEGVALAAEYGITGYPTHLYINPATRKVVYRRVGATGNVDEFNHHADIALQEYVDPLTPEKYAAKFRSGERSEAFLRSYLEKLYRLNEHNDTVLGAYVDVVSKQPATTPIIAFVTSMVSTLDNKAVPYILANASLFPVQQDRAGLNEFFSRWAQGSFERAVKERNPVLVDSLTARIRRYTGNEDRSMDFLYRTQYYTATGDQQGAFQASMDQADYLLTKPVSYFKAEDAKAEAQARKQLRSQLVANHVDSALLEQSVDLNLKDQPAKTRSSSYYSALNLNGLALYIYQKLSTDAALVQKAVQWSKLAMTLSEEMPVWATYAGTHAQLLAKTGRRPEAMKVLESAIPKADATTAPGLRTMLDEMKAGKQ